MPGQRTEGQILIGCWVEQPFAEKIDAALDGIGRSTYLRRALLEKLRRMGISTEGLKEDAPSRLGKGGPRKYPSPRLFPPQK